LELKPAYALGRQRIPSTPECQPPSIQESPQGLQLCHPRSHIVEHVVHCDSHSPNARFPTSFVGLNRDDVLIAHFRRMYRLRALESRNPFVCRTAQCSAASGASEMLQILERTTRAAWRLQCYDAVGAGISRSRQILTTRKSLISRCRGTDDTFPFVRFT